MSISPKMLALGGLLLVLTLGCSSARAAIFYNGTATCLDDKQGLTTPGNPVQAYTCNTQYNQQWNFEGSVIQGVGTTGNGGMCLDIKKGGTTPGTLVDLWTCTGATNQQWYYWNGQRISQASGLCLDVGSGNTSGTQAFINTCNGSAGQQWFIQS